MEKKDVLIVVDMQNDFISDALGTDEAKTIVSNVVGKINEAAKKDDIIYATKDTHEKDYMTTEEGKNLPVEHCIKFTKGWELNKKVEEALENAMGRVWCGVNTICKPTFGSLELGKRLEKLAEEYEIENITLIGLCTDICVLSNAVIAKAAVPNAHIIVDAAACAGVSVKSHDTVLDAMGPIQVEIINRGNEPWR